MAANTFQQLKDRAKLIKNEENDGENTADRVGGSDLAIIEKLEEVDGKIPNKDDFVPLSGTKPGKPVSGDIKVNNNTALVSSTTNKRIGFDAQGNPTVAMQTDLNTTNQSLATLSTKVDSKASQAGLDATNQSLEALSTKVDGKASQAGLDTTNQNLEALTTTVAGKASQAGLNTTNQKLTTHTTNNNVHFIELEDNPNLDDITEQGAYKCMIMNGNINTETWIYVSKMQRGMDYTITRQIRINASGIHTRIKSPEYPNWSEWEEIGAEVDLSNLATKADLTTHTTNNNVHFIELEDNPNLDDITEQGAYKCMIMYSNINTETWIYVSKIQQGMDYTITRQIRINASGIHTRIKSPDYPNWSEWKEIGADVDLSNLATKTELNTTNNNINTHKGNKNVHIVEIDLADIDTTKTTGIYKTTIDMTPGNQFSYLIVTTQKDYNTGVETIMQIQIEPGVFQKRNGKIASSGKPVVWEAWEDIGGDVDLSNLATKAELDFHKQDYDAHFTYLGPIPNLDTIDYNGIFSYDNVNGDFGILLVKPNVAGTIIKQLRIEADKIERRTRDEYEVWSEWEEIGITNNANATLSVISTNQEYIFDINFLEVKDVFDLDLSVVQPKSWYWTGESYIIRPNLEHVIKLDINNQEWVSQVIPDHPLGEYPQYLNNGLLFIN